MLQAKVELVVREDEGCDKACISEGTILAANKLKPWKSRPSVSLGDDRQQAMVSADLHWQHRRGCAGPSHAQR